MDDYKGALFGMTLALLVLAYGGIQHHRAFNILNKNITLPAKTIRLIPMIASSSHWRYIYKSGKKIHLGEIRNPLFTKNQYHPMGSLRLFCADDLPLFVKNSKTLYQDYEIFNWFTDGYLHAVSSKPLQLIDARYLVIIRPFFALWGIEFTPNQNHIKKLNWVRVNT